MLALLRPETQTRATKKKKATEVTGKKHMTIGYRKPYSVVLSPEKCTINTGAETKLARVMTYTTLVLFAFRRRNMNSLDCHKQEQETDALAFPALPNRCSCLLATVQHGLWQCHNPCDRETHTADASQSCQCTMTRKGALD